MKSTSELIEESNCIEGIFRNPTREEVAEHERFVSLDRVTVDELCAFVKVYQPNAVLRDRVGLNVRVGNHVPPPGGVSIPHMLDAILKDANDCKLTAWQLHVQYENLHPFTDGNGRSGRALWYWAHRKFGGYARATVLGFLHTFYYQTLSQSRL